MHFLLLLAQVLAPPELQSEATFQKSTTAVDGTSHTGAVQTQINAEILRGLRRLEGHGEGLRLIESRLFSAAEALFRRANQPAGLAVALYLNGKAAAAEEVMLAAPRDLTMLPFLGEMGTSARTAEAIRVIAQANPANSEANYYLARVTTSRPEAERLLTKAAELDVRDTRALLELSRLHGEDRPKAIAALESLLLRDPSHAPAHYRLATLYHATGETGKSREHMAAFQKLRKQ
jgi:tetratricopeptide (TPR) repeat protein